MQTAKLRPNLGVLLRTIDLSVFMLAVSSAGSQGSAVDSVAETSMMHSDHCGGLALHGEQSFADSCLLFNLFNCP